jgi:hypothetical protein
VVYRVLDDFIAEPSGCKSLCGSRVARASPRENVSRAVLGLFLEGRSSMRWQACLRYRNPERDLKELAREYLRLPEASSMFVGAVGLGEKNPRQEYVSAQKTVHKLRGTEIPC